MSRSGTETRRRTFQVGVRLLPEEYHRLRDQAEQMGKSIGDMLRSHAFADRDALASLLYAMNGFAWYGRDLGPWDSPAVDGERHRWFAQADHLLARLADTEQETTP